MSSLYGGRLKAKKQANKARANGVSERGQSEEFHPSLRAYSVFCAPKTVKSHHGFWLAHLNSPILFVFKSLSRRLVIHY